MTSAFPMLLAAAPAAATGWLPGIRVAFDRGGFAEALLTTAAGLAVAIVALQLDGKPMAADDLIAAVARGWRQDRTPVPIGADRAAHLGAGIELLGKLKRAGVEAVAFQLAGEKKR